MVKSTVKTIEQLALGNSRVNGAAIKREAKAFLESMKDRKISNKEISAIKMILEISESTLPVLDLVRNAEIEAKSILSMVQSAENSIFDFMSLPPVDGLTILAVLCMADDKIAKEAISVLAEYKKSQASKGAKKLHELDYKNIEEMKSRWASGQYPSRNECADVGRNGLKGRDGSLLSFAAARNALKDSPDPDPWPCGPGPNTKRRTT